MGGSTKKIVVTIDVGLALQNAGTYDANMAELARLERQSNDAHRAQTPPAAVLGLPAASQSYRYLPTLLGSTAPTAVLPLAPPEQAYKSGIILYGHTPPAAVSGLAPSAHLYDQYGDTVPGHTAAAGVSGLAPWRH
jgi:hypothetical protein